MRLLHRSQQEKPVERPPSLPVDVKFALRYRDAQLGPRDIARLFDNRLAHLGFYMAMKAGEGAQAVQAGLLSKAAEQAFDLSKLTKHDAAEALGHLASKEFPFVKGQKVAPVHSLGVDAWKARFADKLRPLVGEEGERAEGQAPDRPLFMVANAPYVGLDELAKLSLMRGRSLGILQPAHFGQTVEPVGFMLEPGDEGGVTVNALEHDFTRPDGAVIFDDAMHTGAVRDEVTRFWGDTAVRPDFVAAFVDVGPSVDGAG